MEKVYFLKNLKNLGKTTSRLLADFYPRNSELLVKIHFGESGNKTALFPKDIEPITKALVGFGIKLTFIDTPVAYNSPRSTVAGYQKVVKERGYDRLAPFIISDHFIKVKEKDLTVEVCKELTEAKNVLVISHVKGHACSGFGGAIKNLAMGGVSKKSKCDQHDLGQPEFISDCQGCGVCVEHCPSQAIKMVSQKAKINLERCWGCSICLLECPYNCLVPKKAVFGDLLAQAARAVIKNLSKKTFYINLVKNITQLCDCEVNSGKIIAQDIGSLFSKSPLAIDKASLDLIKQNENKEVFWENNHKNPYSQLDFASQYLGQKSDYRLIKI